MESTVKEIRAECDEIVALMAECGFVRPRCNVWIEGGDAGLTVSLRWYAQTYDDSHKFIAATTLFAAFAEAREWIMDQPTAEDRARQEAIKATAAAKEAWDKVTDRTRQDAAAKAQIEALMKALSENILTKGEGV